MHEDRPQPALWTSPTHGVESLFTLVFSCLFTSHLGEMVHPPFLDENSGSSTSFLSSARGQKFLGHFKWQT